jgi:hypothetical protein
MGVIFLTKNPTAMENGGLDLLLITPIDDFHSHFRHKLLLM